MKQSNLFLNFKIGTRLSLSFGIIIVLVLFTIIFILNRMNKISEDINELYEHPFTVSQALLSAEINMHMMHKHMKDVALSQNTEELEVAIQDVKGHAMKVDRYLNEAKAQYLGDPKDFDLVIEKFTAWAPIRNDVISLTKAGEKVKAAGITKGRGELHVVELENSLQELIDFAGKKALDLKKELFEQRKELE